MSKLYFLFTACVPLLLTSCKTTPSQAPQNVAWADSIVDQSTAIMEGSNPKASVHFLDSAFATKRGLGNKALWRKYRCMVNYYEYYYQDTAARRIYVDSMLWASKNDKELHSYEYSRSLYAMAKLLQKERHFNEAFKYYYDGRQFAKGELDNCSLADFSNALGIIRYQQEHYKEAIPYLHQAYREISSCTSPSFEYAFLQRQSVLNSIALCFEKSGQNDSAVAYYNKALAFIKSQKDIHPERQNFITTARGVVEGNLGGTYLRIGRFGLAEQHLKTNIMLNDRAGFAIEDAQTGKVKLAHLYLLQGRLPDAAVLLNQLQSDLESGRGKSSYNSEIWSRWYSLKSLYLEKKGDFRNAYFYFKRYHAHRDSLDAASKGFKDIGMDQLLREQSQQHKLGILEKEAEVKTVYVYALTIFLLMAISIATISWRNYRRSRQNIAKLTDLNAQLQQALTALENSQRENTRMLKVVAHDLRGPIGAISSIAEMMIQETGRSTDDLEMLSIIKQTGSNSLELVNNLMHLNSPTEQVSKKSQVDLSALIKQCADMLGPRAREKGQRIHLDLMPVKAVLNYEQFWRVISNLISNAIKFSPHASKISVFLHQDDSIKIVVKDQGIGIPSGIGNKIFDAFTDSRRKGTAGEESFGLGLSITKQIVEAHGGSISYTSLPDAGTTFYIELPKTATDAG